MGTIGSAFLGYTRVFGAGEDRFSVPISNGLISLYNPAYTSDVYPNGYDNGTIVDLWGDADLETAVETVDVRSDGSIYFYTSSYASSSAELSADLLGTGSEFTIIAYSYLHGSGSYESDGTGGGRYKIGTAGRNSWTNVIAEVGVTSGTGTQYQLGMGATSASFGFDTVVGNSMFVKDKRGGADYFAAYGVSYDATPPPPSFAGAESSSFLAVSKANQNASYTKPDTNVSFYLDDFWSDTVFRNEQKTTVGTYEDLTAPDNNIYIFDGTGPEVLNTSIVESFLTINPDWTGYGGDAQRNVQQFALKGFAVYNRVLTTSEIQSMKDWFDESY